MSRIGKMPIEIPGGVEVKVDGRTVHVKGSQGELAQQLPDGIQVAADNGTLTVSRDSEAQRTRAMHGLTRSLIANMVEGVSKGFQKSLEIHGVGYRASLQGTKLVLSVGFSHPVEMQAPEGIQFEVPQPTRIIVKGISKELVGQVAADIRAVRPPEPYLAKGIRYEGERIRRKAGKAGRAG